MSVDRGNTVPDFEFDSIWPTNILRRRLPALSAQNDELSRIAIDFQREHFETESQFPYRMDRENLLTSVRSPALAALFHYIRETAYLYLSTFYPGVDLPKTKLTYNSFANLQNKAKRWVNPHAHVESQFVVTYYSRVHHGREEREEDLPGALSFHDPRPLMANWMMRKENKLFTMKLMPGTMVVFPGYVQHSTFPFFDDSSEKVAIVTNVKLHRSAETFRGENTTAEEILSWQAQKEAADVRG